MKTQSCPTQVQSPASLSSVRESAFVDRIGPTVTAILRHKSGMTLDAADSRGENLDALDLYHDVMARLWERVSEATPGVDAIDDVRAYAASVTHNAWSDHLRHKHPNRTSLKNRLCYFLNHEPGFLIWMEPGGERVAARGESLSAAMSLPRLRAGHPLVASLRLGVDRLPLDVLPGRPFDALQSADWRRLLSAIFHHLRAPIVVDDLVSICAVLLDVVDRQVTSIDENDEALSLTADAHTEPLQIVQTRSMLRRLWVLAQQLPPHYRLAYLLNIPGPGKSRGDIEVLLLDGVATMNQIEAALCFEDEDYQVLGEALDGVDPAAITPVYPGGPTERFVQLWHHLPLSDVLIARLTGLQPQQVINRRMLALRQLARGFGLDRRKERGRA